MGEIMKQFSKKTDLTVLIITSAVFALSAALILFSADIFTFIQYVAETKVVHHSVKLATVRQKITPFIVFSIFAVIIFDALFFVKFSEKSKIILLAQFCLAALILTAAACFLKTPQFMDSDMASEIMLAKECFTHKTFWSRSWHYSTEIRLLHTQLIASPLFAFTSNWLTVKALSAVILCLALPSSLLFLLNALKVKSVWLKLLCSLLIFLPWSNTMWGMVQLGNYYIPHIALSFVYTALFISLAYTKMTAKKNENLYRALFCTRIYFRTFGHSSHFEFPTSHCSDDYCACSTPHGQQTGRIQVFPLFYCRQTRFLRFSEYRAWRYRLRCEFAGAKKDIFVLVMERGSI